MRTRPQHCSCSRGAPRAVGAIAAVLGGLALAAPAGAQTAGGWTAARSQPSAAAWSMSAVLPGGNVLVAGGQLTASPGATAETQIYHLATNTWAAGPSMTSARTHAASVVLANGDVLIVGGVDANGDYLGTGEIYHPGTNTFTAIPGQMSTPRANGVAVLLENGEVLIAGGTADGTGALDTADLYDPATNSFSPVASVMSAERDFPAATRLANGDVLIAGGIDSSLADGATADIYDHGTGSFSPVANSMSVGRAAEGIAALSGGRAIVFGGLSGQNATSATSDIYNATSNRFTAGPAMPVGPALFGSATLSDGRILAAGGVVDHAGSGAVTNASEVYDPSANTWESAGTLPAATAEEALQPLAGDRAFEAGGTVVGALVGTSSLWAAGTSDSTPPQSSPRGTVTGPTTNLIDPTGAPGPVNTSATTHPALKLTLSGLARRLTLRRLLRGVTFSVRPSAAAALHIRLLALAGRAPRSRSRTTALATRSYRLSRARRSVHLLPARRLVPRQARRLKVEVVILAVDTTGAKVTVTRTITVVR